MGLLGKKLTDAQRAEELFSPYIDKQVTTAERQFLERYLADHPEAREKFELLQAAVKMTRSLPQVKAPRSFVLPRSMARKPSLTLRLYPAMRFATVAAAALFAFALVGDLATSSRLAASQPAAEMLLSARSAAPQEASAEPDQAPLQAPAPAPTETPAPLAPAGAPAAPTGAPTATQSAAAERAAQSTGAAADSQSTEAAAEPPAIAELAAPTEPAPVAEQSGLAEADASALKTSEAETESAPVQQIDILRLAVFVLAGLAIALAATTLILSRRLQ